MIKVSLRTKIILSQHYCDVLLIFVHFIHSLNGNFWVYAEVTVRLDNLGRI